MSALVTCMQQACRAGQQRSVGSLYIHRCNAAMFKTGVSSHQSHAVHDPASTHNVGRKLAPTVASRSRDRFSTFAALTHSQTAGEVSHDDGVLDQLFYYIWSGQDELHSLSTEPGPALQGVQAHPVLQSFIGRVLAEYWGEHQCSISIAVSALRTAAWSCMQHH